MNLTEPTLFVHVGAVNTRAFLFSGDGKKNHLTATDEHLTPGDPQLLLRHWEEKFQGRFSQVKTIAFEPFAPQTQGEAEVFLEAGKLLSKMGEVLVIDLGAKKVSLVYGSYGRVTARKLDLGLGQSAGRILRQVPVELLGGLLEEELDLVDIQNYLGKKTLYPGFVPFSRAELNLEMVAAAAILSEAKKAVTGDTRQSKVPKFCLLTGACLGDSPHVQLALFYFLQGWQPRGVLQIYLDPQGLLYPYALMGDFEGLMGQIKGLGTVVSLNHQFGPGERLGDAALDLGLNEILRLEIKAGELTKIPFRAGASGRLSISLKRGVLLRGEAALSQVIDGGEIGVLIDARGRPLPRLPLNREGKKRLRLWLESLF